MSTWVHYHIHMSSNLHLIGNCFNFSITFWRFSNIRANKINGQNNNFDIIINVCYLVYKTIFVKQKERKKTVTTWQFDMPAFRTGSTDKLKHGSYVQNYCILISIGRAEHSITERRQKAQKKNEKNNRVTNTVAVSSARPLYAFFFSRSVKWTKCECEAEVEKKQAMQIIDWW